MFQTEHLVSDYHRNEYTDLEKYQYSDSDLLLTPNRNLWQSDDYDAAVDGFPRRGSLRYSSFIYAG